MLLLRLEPELELRVKEEARGGTGGGGAAAAWKWRPRTTDVAEAPASVARVAGSGDWDSTTSPTLLAPRLVPAPGSKAADEAGVNRSLLMRPRTRAVWLVPADSRRFRAVVTAAAGPQAAEAAVVAVAVDDREVFRQQIDDTAGSGEANACTAPAQAAMGIPIDVDLTDGRRLTVTVDFVPGGGIGGAVRFGSPVIER